MQTLEDVSQLSRVALLAVHAPSRSRQAALVALLTTLLAKIKIITVQQFPISDD